MKRALTLGIGTAVVSLGASALAVPVYVDKDKGVAVNVGVYIQPAAQFSMAAEEGKGSPGVGAPDGKSPTVDFYLRRIRLLLSGTVTKNLSYSVVTDQPNLGKGGDFSSSMFIQEAFVTYEFAPEAKIDMGMFLLPFTHHVIEGSATYNTIETHAEVLRFVRSKGFRDTGIQLRGSALDQHLDYRIGVFEGARATTPPPAGKVVVLNEAGIPRFAGQVRYNIAGTEPGFTTKGIHFSEEAHVSIGASGDFQNKAVVKDGKADTYYAVAGDVFADIPMGGSDGEIVAAAAVINYAAGSPGLPKGGVGGFGELGYRIGDIEPVAWVDFVTGKNLKDETTSVLAPHLGMNFWFNKYAWNLKADVAYVKRDSASAGVTKDIFGTLMAQLVY